MAIRQATCFDEQRIKAYIGNEYERCLYLYLNFLQYGCDSDEITVWLQENKAITAVILRYHSCIHLFSNACDFSESELVSFLKTQSVSLIQAEKVIIQKLEADFKTVHFYAEYGSVLKLPSLPKMRPESSLEFSAVDSESEIEQLAELYCADALGKSYQKDDFILQITNRLKENYGRTFLLKSENSVIGSISTWAENSQIAVESGLVVAPAYRNKGYAKSLISFLMQLLKNKALYAICYTDVALHVHKSVGFRQKIQYGKLVYRGGYSKNHPFHYPLLRASQNQNCTSIAEVA